MSKRKFNDINIPSENKSFISGYKDGEKVIKLFQKDINFNLKDYFDGLYNYYVNTLQSSYGFDKKDESSFGAFQSTEIKPEPSSFSSRAFQPISMKPKVPEPSSFSSRAFQPTDMKPKVPEQQKFSFGASPISMKPKVPEQQKFSFGLSVPTDMKSTLPLKPYKSFSFGLSTEPELVTQNIDSDFVNKKFGEQTHRQTQIETTPFW